MKRMKLDPELLAAIEGWKKLPQTQLAIVTQALYSLTQHGDAPQWIRDSAASIVQEVCKQCGIPTAAGR